MELVLQRKTSKPALMHATLGVLSDERGMICHTLEDRVREVPGKPVSSWKIPGQTAIPAGRYQVVVNRSPRFQTDLPLLVGVEGFEGVRIHAGNTAADTEGCILVGRRTAGDAVLESRFALLELMIKLKDASVAGEEIWIDVRNPE